MHSGHLSALSKIRDNLCLSVAIFGRDEEMKRKPFRGLGAILFKEFIMVLRDPMTLFFMFFPPLIEMIAFGYALDNDVKHMAMIILNEDRTVESRQLIDRFVNTQTFRVVGEVQSVEEMESEMRKGRAYVGHSDSAHLHARCARRTPRASASADGWIEFHHRAAGAQHRYGRSPDPIRGIASARNAGGEVSQSIFGRKCSTTRRCAARIFLCRA